MPGRGRAMRFKRRLSPAQGDRFLRWADLDARGGMIEYTRSTFLADARRVEPVRRHAARASEDEEQACTTFSPQREARTTPFPL